MSVQIIKQPNSYCFAGNPVSFVFSSSTNDEFRVVINVAGESLELSLYPYGTSAPYQADLELSDLLQKYFNVPTISDSDIITPIDNFSLPYSISVSGVILFSGVAFQGGLSKSFLKMLYDSEYKDIFNYRLNNKNNQFLFTTRSQSKNIKIRYSEISSFVFIHPGTTIKFISGNGAIIDTPAMLKGTLCAMNLKKALAIYEFSYEDVKYIDVFTDNEEYSFRINIIPSILSEERYLLKFKNSLGAYEFIDITGRAYCVPESNEEYSWKSLSSYGFFEDKRDRVDLRSVLEVETGFKTKDELDFILDMVHSDDIYIIYPDASEIKVLVSVDNIRYRNRQTVTHSIPLKIKEIVENKYLSPNINPYELSTGGIFDAGYDYTFE